ncbi:MAG: hypothetical protein MZU95_07100 [Desulfomicrobium escambiense]|nr:hypothetical protein [Desulfomicrobium escambiense]
MATRAGRPLRACGVVDRRRRRPGPSGSALKVSAEVQGQVILLGRQAPVAEVGLLVRGQEDEVEALEGGRGQGMHDLGLVPELAELGELLLDVGVEELEARRRGIWPRRRRPRISLPLSESEPTSARRGLRDLVAVMEVLMPSGGGPTSAGTCGP